MSNMFYIEIICISIEWHYDLNDYLLTYDLLVLLFMELNTFDMNFNFSNLKIIIDMFNNISGYLNTIICC